MRTTFLFSLLFILLLSTCNHQAPQETADLILLNGQFYTVNPEQPTVEAIAIAKGRIIALGTSDEMTAWQTPETEILDLQGQFAMPGFIEGHGHFSGMGSSLLNLNFLEAKSWDEIVQMVAEKVKTAAPGEWITGRGWHQEKWLERPEQQYYGYPFHDVLSAVSPNNPVLLDHASGHAVFANKAAMDAAGITLETPNPSGGAILRDSRGAAIGVFEEKAEGLIVKAYQDYLATLDQEQQKAIWYKGVELAQAECLRNGITSFQDAGSSFEEIARYKELAEKQAFDIRLWAMLRHSYDRMKDSLSDFPIIDVGQNFFTCRAIKSEVDGALGSFGAWLLTSYSDKPNFHGQNTTPIPEVKRIAGLAIAHDMQLCVHAIGDRANRVVLNIYEETFNAYPDKINLRWRIEHAQHLDTSDIPRFKELGVIASMQGIHCTSDAPFVVSRLGESRARFGAYPWRSLLDAGVVVANGTDVPVENIDPIQSFYASVTRRRTDTGLVFFPEQAMTREEAVYSYTLGNAYAAFEEHFKGSLEVGKVADIVVLSKDLIHCSDEEILQTEVVMTFVDGKLKYKRG
ncbi:MAG TPA: amidohydrolase [Saprospiraceae bacterium]|nr:amidohydrolase [Saprospiraceae bacterium]HMQ83629.1 amidohydrolase [Saprospiraceae bacterium]